MSTIQLRHFSNIEPQWLQDFGALLTEYSPEYRPLSEEEVFEEYITPPVFTLYAPLELLQEMPPERFAVFKICLLGLLGDAYTTQQFGYWKSETDFNPAMPLAFFLKTPPKSEIKLYFRNTEVTPAEMEEGLDKLQGFLKSHVWNAQKSADGLREIAFFFDHNWQLLN